MNKQVLPVGKLDSKFLKEMLDSNQGFQDPDVILGPAEGEDGAIIKITPNHLLVTATDPITFPTEKPGWYGVQVNANDVVTRGAVPRWFKATILFPAGKTTKDHVSDIFGQIAQACQAMNIALVGGHTEVTSGIDRILITGVMDGLVKEGQEVKTSGAKVGDHVIITKGIALEGTSIIASEKYDDLREKGYTEKFLREARNFIYQPGISIVKEALLAHRIGVNSMHDLTEGGLANGLAEIAHASDRGLLVWRKKIPVFNQAKILCQEYGLDPFGTIASGALLITAVPENGNQIISMLRKNGISASHIGQIMPKDFGLKIADNQLSKDHEDLRYSATDEITKIF